MNTLLIIQPVHRSPLIVHRIYLLFRTAIVRRFTGNRHIVRMTFHYTCIGNAGKLSVMKFLNVSSATVSHTCTQTTSS